MVGSMGATLTLCGGDGAALSRAALSCLDATPKM
jgi:hypothetical protein